MVGRRPLDPHGRHRQAGGRDRRTAVARLDARGAGRVARRRPDRGRHLGERRAEVAAARVAARRPSSRSSSAATAARNRSTPGSRRSTGTDPDRDRRRPRPRRGATAASSRRSSRPSRRPRPVTARPSRSCRSPRPSSGSTVSSSGPRSTGPGSAPRRRRRAHDGTCSASAWRRFPPDGPDDLHRRGRAARSL